MFGCMHGEKAVIQVNSLQICFSGIISHPLQKDVLNKMEKENFGS